MGQRRECELGHHRLHPSWPPTSSAQDRGPISSLLPQAASEKIRFPAQLCLARMNDFCEELKLRIAAIRAQGLYRELRRVDSPQLPHIQIGGKRLLNFSSNDYLGLANDPRLKEAAAKAVERYGAGSGASRLLCGSLAPHHHLEQSLAELVRAADQLKSATVTT